MDMLKSVTGSGDKAADEKKAAAAAPAGPGFVENVKTGAANAHAAATEGVNKGCAAASDLVGQAKDYLNKPAETKPAPAPAKTEGGGVGDYVKKAQDFVTGSGEKK